MVIVLLSRRDDDDDDGDDGMSIVTLKIETVETVFRLNYNVECCVAVVAHSYRSHKQQQHLVS